MARFQNKFEFEIYDPETQDFKVLENVEYPTQGEDYLDTTKDVSTIVIDGSRESRRIPKGTRINKYVTVVNLDTQEQTPREKIKEYIVEQDIVETVRFFDPKLYKHNMSLIETVKDTEGYQLTNLTFSYYQPYIYRIYNMDDFVYRPGNSGLYVRDKDRYGGYLGNINKDIEYWLMDDLDFNGYNFGEPNHINRVGSTQFGLLQGSFYGMGHTIKNLYNSTQVLYYEKEKLAGDNSYIETLSGFFNYIDEGAVVSDLNFDNISTSSSGLLDAGGQFTYTGMYFGILAGYSNGLIRNCHISNSSLEIVEPSDEIQFNSDSGVQPYKDNGMIKSVGFLAGGATKIEQCSAENNTHNHSLTTEIKHSGYSYPEIPSDTPYYEIEMKQHQIYVGDLVGVVGKRKVEHNFGFKDYDYNAESFSTSSPYYISDDELNNIDGLYKVDNFLNKQSRTWIKNSYVANNSGVVNIHLRSLTESDFSTGYDFPYPSCKYYIGGLSGSRTNIEKSFVYDNSKNINITADGGSDVGAHYLEFSNFMTQTDDSDYIDRLRYMNNFIDGETNTSVNIGLNVTNINIQESNNPFSVFKNNEDYPALSYISHSEFSNINTFI